MRSEKGCCKFCSSLFLGQVTLPSWCACCCFSPSWRPALLRAQVPTRPWARGSQAGSALPSPEGGQKKEGCKGSWSCDGRLLCVCDLCGLEQDNKLTAPLDLCVVCFCDQEGPDIWGCLFVFLGVCMGMLEAIFRASTRVLSDTTPAPFRAAPCSLAVMFSALKASVGFEGRPCVCVKLPKY